MVTCVSSKLASYDKTCRHFLTKAAEHIGIHDLIKERVMQKS